MADAAFAPEPVGVKLQHTVAHVPCNLATYSSPSGNKFFAHVCDNIVSVTVTKHPLASTPPKYLSIAIEAAGVPATVSQVKFVENESRDTAFIVVLSSLGTNFYDISGRLLLAHTAPAGPDVFARGAARLGSSVCVGLSTGALHVFSLAGTPAFQRELSGPPSPVADVAADASLADFFAVAHESGALTLRERGNTHSILWTHPGDGVPILTLAAVGDLVATGLLSGRIDVFSGSLRQLLVSVQAHARPIFALAVDRTHGLLLSASEDTRACVWALPPAQQTHPVSLKFSVTITNRMLSGAAFLDGDVCLSCYDCDKLVVFPHQPSPSA